MAVPVKALSSVAEAHVLEPSDPFKYKVPVPTLALNSVCVFGEASTAVPPEVVVWKSHPAIISCASAETDPIHPTVSASSSEARNPPKLLLSLRGSERRRAIPKHHFVKLKFELRRMFFIFLVSYFFHRIQTTLATAIKTDVAQLQSPRIHSHTHNLLLFLQKARTIL